MKNAIILHGKPDKEEYYDPASPSPSNSHWIPWTQAQLTKKDIATATPDIPQAYEPQWDIWKKEVERFDITPTTLLVGHSCGAGFWLRWLCENKERKVGKVILVAPSLGIGWGASVRHQFFGDDFSLDPYMAIRTRGLYVFYSDDDKDFTLQAVEEIRDQVPSVDFREFHGKGHFTSDTMPTNEFPELLEELLAP